MALVAGAASDSRAQAPAPPSEPQPWPEAETVLTLLRADAAAALADCRVPGICGPGSQPSPTMLPPAPVPARDEVRVAAIYGTARKLTIDLVVNGAQLRYQAGRADPVAGSAVMDAYRLLAIDGACVRLHRDGRDHTACLDGEGARP